MRFKFRFVHKHLTRYMKLCVFCCYRWMAVLRYIRKVCFCRILQEKEKQSQRGVDKFATDKVTGLMLAVF